jgi:hypothetical protein
VTNPTIDARLVGADEDGGYVQFDVFRRFCHVMSVCLRRAEAVVTAYRGRIRYRVSDLRASSAAIALEAVRPKKGPDSRVEVVNFFKETVAALQSGSKIDGRLTPEGLKDFRELYAGVKRIKEVWIGGRQITSRYVANIDEILKPALVSEGSVIGWLERLNVHEKNEFVLYPPLWEAVVCTFPDEMFEQVRSAVKRNVTVRGTLTYPPDRPYPTKVRVKGLEVHPPDEELPTLRQLRGLFRGCTGDKTATEYVRAIRDEHD